MGTLQTLGGNLVTDTLKRYSHPVRIYFHLRWNDGL